MVDGKKLQGIRLSSEEVVREFSSVLSILSYSHAYGDVDEINFAVKSLQRSRHADLTLLDEIKWAVLQPDFQILYKRYQIDAMDRPESWRDFQEFILSL